MSTSYEAQGVIHSIDETRSYGANGFTKREFVIKLSGEGENPDYPNFVALELIKDKCAMMDQYQVGEEVKVSFNLGGRLWNAPGKPEKCFVSLQAWRVERLGAQAQQAPAGQFQPAGAPPQSYDDFDDDVPF
jgi:hypothetical protein